MVTEKKIWLINSITIFVSRNWIDNLFTCQLQTCVSFRFPKTRVIMIHCAFWSNIWTAIHTCFAKNQSVSIGGPAAYACTHVRMRQCLRQCMETYNRQQVAEFKVGQSKNENSFRQVAILRKTVGKDNWLDIFSGKYFFLAFLSICEMNSWKILKIQLLRL